MKDLREGSASSLVPGAWYLGRDEFHLYVEKVERGPKQMKVVSLDRDGWEHVERYRYSDRVMIWWKDWN